MNRFHPWAQESWHFGPPLLVFLIIGTITGYVLPALLLFCLLYLGWHIYNLWQLESWLCSKQLPVPETIGIWGEIYHHLYRQQQRNRNRKRKLSAMLKRFQHSTAAMPDGTVILTRANYEIEWMNQAAVQLLGLRQREDKGQPVANLLRAPRFIEFLNRQRDTGEVDAIRLLSPADKNLMLRISIVPYAGNRYLLLARDVTELQRLEQVRSDFIANVSHELRTPLTVVNGFIETLRDDDCPKDWQRPLLLMAQQTARMRYIVEDLLLLSKLESDNNDQSILMMQPVNIAEMLHSIYEEAHILSGNQHNISLDADEDLQIFGQAEELRSAFSNLVSNAVRYTPPNGHIRLRWYRDDEGVHFEVNDTGEGISPEHIPRLTERFYRVDVARSRNKGGTGLGLAIVKHVLNHHQGHLHIFSTLGEGSTFRCDFPPEASRFPHHY